VLHKKSFTAWTGLSRVLRPHQHSIGYMGDGFYRSKDPTCRRAKSLSFSHNRSVTIHEIRPWRPPIDHVKYRTGI